jgi:hypothetical protein
VRLSYTYSILREGIQPLVFQVLNKHFRNPSSDGTLGRLVQIFQHCKALAEKVQHLLFTSDPWLYEVDEDDVWKAHLPILAFPILALLGQCNKSALPVSRI